MSSLVRVCPDCDAICMALNARCSACGRELAGTELVELRDLVSDPAPADDAPDSAQTERERPKRD